MSHKHSAAEIIWFIARSVFMGFFARLLLGYLLSIFFMPLDLLNYLKATDTLSACIDVLETFIKEIFLSLDSVPKVLFYSFILGALAVRQYERDEEKRWQERYGYPGEWESRESMSSGDSSWDFYNRQMDAIYKREFSFRDFSGAYRRYGDKFIDSKGNWASWDGFYDSAGNWANGDSFVDGHGNWASLDRGFWDFKGNWVKGRN